MNRADIIDQNFIRRTTNGNLPAPAGNLSLTKAGLTASEFIELFDSQLLSRHLDLISRKLQQQRQAFYTIGSAGHEGNAAIAHAFRVDDIAFLHYRDGAFFIQRSKQLAEQTPMMDMLLSFCASADDPISGGRHKVLGSKTLFMPPQTSTIASHLPKAVGAAYSISLAKRMNIPSKLPENSVVICSFGDASLNHSTAQGAINGACWAAYQGVPLPLVFICEDNGIGISTPTPEGWVQQNIQGRKELHYIPCNGMNLLDTYQAAKQAAHYARDCHLPVFLRIKTVRLLGHAGSDLESQYHSEEQISAIEAQDPLLHSAYLLIHNQVLTPKQITDRYRLIAEKVAETAAQATKRPKLQTASAIMKSIIPPPSTALNVAAESDSIAKKAQGVFNDAPPTSTHNNDQTLAMSRCINLVLTEVMHRYDNVVLAGEDIAAKGGVYGVTKQLSELFGQHRVINTLLDEQSILGLAMGLAHNGLLPIVEIQFLAYIHNAEDQIRGEAATLSFFSNGQFTNPMIIRIAGLGYQKGFGGHFHNDNSFNVFRDIPGIIIACPSNGHDAVLMLREAVRLVRQEQRIVIFIEPIALYAQRDLYKPGDGLWSHPYPTLDRPISAIKIGQIGQYGEGKTLALLSYGNGYYLCRQAAKELSEQGIQLRVIDLRWLAPLDEKAIIDAIKPCEYLLIVDECRKTGSLSEQLITLMHERQCLTASTVSRLSAKDSFIPLGPAATITLPSKESIVKTAMNLVGKHAKK